MKNQKKFQMRFDFSGKRKYRKDMGVETRTNSGSHHRHGGGFYSIPTRTHCIYFADLRERSCVITTGTTIGVFLTPDQARFFCARRKAQEKHNINDLTNRRSRMSETSNVKAGNTPASANPVQILVLGEKLMIRCKGVKIIINMSQANPIYPANRCLGCNCAVQIEPEN